MKVSSEGSRKPGEGTHYFKKERVDKLYQMLLKNRIDMDKHVTQDELHSWLFSFILGTTLRSETARFISLTSEFSTYLVHNKCLGNMYGLHEWKKQNKTLDSSEHLKEPQTRS